MTKKGLEEASREELVEYLESWGFACYDSETTEELRTAALQNCQTEGETLVYTPQYALGRISGFSPSDGPKKPCYELPSSVVGAVPGRKKGTISFEGFSMEACGGGVSPPEAVLVPREEWEAARNREDEGVVHPCNSWNINECDCKGACSCHWRATASPGMIRASGDVICEVCGKKYCDHPMDMEQLSYDGHPFLHIRCDGMRLKL
jgi:hypothetical protein